MLSLRELRRASMIVGGLVSGARLRRVSSGDAFQVVLTLESPFGKWNVLLSCDPQTARLCLTNAVGDGPSQGSFIEYARAHLVGSVCEWVRCQTENRQVSLALRSRDGVYELVLSILGARSNIYLLDSEGRLVHAVRPLDLTRQELKIGEAWTDPAGGVRSEGDDRWETVPDELYCRILDEEYRKRELRQKADSIGKLILNALKKEQNFLERKALHLLEDLGEAQQAESCKRKGELLKGVLHGVKPGTERVVATDFETGEEVVIELDPKLSPAANMEAYFARYQKQSRGLRAIQSQMEEVAAAQERLAVIMQQVEAVLGGDMPDVQGLEMIAASPEVCRVLQRYSRERVDAPSQAKTGKKEVPSRLLPKRYKTRDGLEIWVGRNDESNDYLTTRLARGNDLFFHLEGYPGSHVVLRTEGRLDPPSDSIIDACELAAHFSKLKNAGIVDIHVAPIKDVKKPRGARPGLVYVRKGRTIHLKRDPKRLQGILAARLDSF